MAGLRLFVLMTSFHLHTLLSTEGAHRRTTNPCDLRGYEAMKQGGL